MQKAIIFSFRKNDLDPSKGKQIEFNSAKVEDFFNFTSSEVNLTFRYVQEGSTYNGTRIKTYLKLSPERGDYKIYQNTDGSPDLKDFFRSSLGLNEQRNINDYFALKKVDESNYDFFYFPQSTTIDVVYKALKLDKSQVICDIENSSKNDSSVAITNRTFEEPRQLIYFGAPGTGKSYTLNDNSKKFAEQGDVVSDEQQSLKLAVENAQAQIGSRYILLNAIGHKYSSLLKNLTKSQIRTQFGKNGDLIYIGANAKDIVDRLQDKNDAELNEDFIKNLIKDETARNGADKLKWVNAIGYKYSSFLSDYSLSSLKETFELSGSQKWWIYRGAHAALSTDNEIEKKQNCVERVTFHPNYSYAQFVGTYKPIQDEDDSKGIVYSYVPGPFMRTYVRAKRAEQNGTGEKFLLIIEEINRANVAAVFGDVFQLLDRKNGESEYPIAASEDIKKYLQDQGIADCDELKIPSNMYIWATMNSADQGVFPMDTAFKRRWEFEYIGVDDKEDKIKEFEIPMQEKKDDAGNLVKDAEGNVIHEWMKWNELRTKINNKLTDCGKNEDKLLGPFFISLEKLNSVNGHNEKEAVDFIKSFKSKVLMYLFEDVCKMRPGDLFNCEKMRYSEICKKFDSDGIGVFNF